MKNKNIFYTITLIRYKTNSVSLTVNNSYVLGILLFMEFDFGDNLPDFSFLLFSKIIIILNKINMYLLVLWYFM